MAARGSSGTGSPGCLAEVERRFGLSVRIYRVGELALRVAEVDRVDELVREIYPAGASLHGDAPVWMVTWPAALGLAEHLALDEPVAGKRVLELGCGTAAPGIAAERAGAVLVVCTDCHPLALELASHNAGLNACERLQTRLLDWYRPELDGQFDLVVGSEVVYFEKSFPALLKVLRRCTAPGGRILLSDPLRPQMEAFVKMCGQEGLASGERFRTVHLPEQSYRVRITTLVPSS